MAQIILCFEYDNYFCLDWDLFLLLFLFAVLIWAVPPSWWTCRYTQGRNRDILTASTNVTMYSVEDLLISHGYKLPKHPVSSSTPTPTAVSSSYPAPSSTLPSYDKHQKFLESIPGHSRTVNGYERSPFGSNDGAGHSEVHIGSCSNNNESRDRGQPRPDGLSRSQIDIHSLGDSLITDSGWDIIIALYHRFCIMFPCYVIQIAFSTTFV